MKKILIPTFLIVIALIIYQSLSPQKTTAAMFTIQNNALVLIGDDNQQTRVANVAARIFDQQNDYALYAEKTADQLSASEYTGGADLWLTNKTATIHKQIVSTATVLDAIIAPRTQRIFYLTNDAQLFSVDFDGTNVTSLANKVISPALSTDEKFLTYQKLNESWQPNDYYENSRGIMIYDLTTNKEQTVTTDNEDFAPFFSPKATKIIFNSLSPEGLASLFIVNADGSKRTQLTNVGQKFVTAATAPTPANQPTWSGDGKHLVYESGNEIWLLEFNADLTTVARGDRIAYGKSPRWIDDKTIGILTNNAANNIIRVDTNGNLIK
jgi:Tol biopolymer transport system component